MSFNFKKRYLWMIAAVLVGGVSLWLGFKTFKTVENRGNASQAKLGAPLFHHLGNYHHAITTKSPLAQRYFDQGLIFFYGFNYAESIRSFQEAVQLDPQCAMCYWGLALALGSKNNTVLNGSEKKDAVNAVKNAAKFVHRNSPIEKAYITALAQRYSEENAAKNNDADKQKSDCISCHGGTIVSPEQAKAYASSMKNVMEQYPRDIDAKILYVAALIEAVDWNFYTKEQEPTPEGLEIIAVLESALQTDPKNPAANHFYIHAIESSKDPYRAMASADLLRDAVPGVDHLVHMPAHIYIVTGRYHDATIANQKAVAAYKEYIGESWGQGFEPVKNYLTLHNLYFLWVSSMLEGRSKLAFETAEELVALTPLSLAKETNLQAFYAIPYFTMVRFGYWNVILEEAQPLLDLQYQMGMWHFARGIAFAHLEKPDEADSELVNLKEIAEEGPTPKNLDKKGDVQLKIAVEILEAAIADMKGQDDAMVAHWQKAVQLQEDMGYFEPPIWFFPPREGLAAALLKAQRPKEAEAAYLQVLKHYPENGWTLFGLAQSLRAQGKYQEAERTQERFNKAWIYADMTLPIR